MLSLDGPVVVDMQAYVWKLTAVFIKPWIGFKASHLPQALPFTEFLSHEKYSPRN